ncbi:hypothetical protein EP331_00265 [bacterium]|nr:MAG: hypothetical protein EP331_00265 [bacterium]
MEKDIKQKFIKYAEWLLPSIGHDMSDLRPTDLSELTDKYLINCLEAKPKALHSMKEGENECRSCGDPIPDGLEYCKDCFW